ncbi:MAG: ACP phosphodiesterase [Chitinophagaceae bacterium]
MNYLAHAYLSFGHPGTLVGNLVSDFVKGRKQYDYPPDIRKGITLHRLIDDYTDAHAATAEAKAVFRPAYRLYSGAFVDVVYDHFLATDEQEFPPGALAQFAQQVYAVLSDHIGQVPPRFGQLFPYMQSQNWLLHYSSRQGIAGSMRGLVRRALYLTESETAFQLFEQHYQLLQQCYRQFWKDIRPFARAQYELLHAGRP